MLLDNEYTLIPHVKLKLTYDNEVVNVVTLKKDDVVDCQYREDGTKKRIVGKIAKIGYKFNSELGAIDGSIYFQIDGSQEYDGNVVYINIDNFLSVRIIKTGSMITNPVCSVDNADQNISLIREDDTGKVQYSKDGLTWKNIVKGGQSPNDPELHPPTAEVLKNYVKKTELDIYKAEVTNKFSEIEIDPSVIASIKSKVHDFESKLEDKLDKDKYKEYGNATSEKAGISKLYKEEGDNEDGSLTQKFIKELFAKKLDKADYHQSNVEQATSEKLGTVKLFNEAGTNEDGTINQKVVSELLDKKLNKDDYHQTTVEEATSDKSGTVKLYNEAGNKEDGTVTQKFVSESLDKKLNKDDYHQTTVEVATDFKAGISKLYTGSGTGEDGSVTQKGITDLLDTKLNKSEYHQITVEEANDIKAGILKLYKVTGDNEDGTVTQKLFKDSLEEKLNKSEYHQTTVENADDAKAGIGKLYKASGMNEDGSITQKALSELFDKKLNKDDYHQITVEAATNSKAGISKLYKTLGTGLDGSIDQKTITDNLNLKLSKNAVSNTLDVEDEGKVLDARQGKILYDKIKAIVVSPTPKATDSVSGTVKLFTTSGQNVDGTVTQKLVTDELNKKLDKASLSVSLVETAAGKALDATVAKTLKDQIDQKADSSVVQPVQQASATVAGKAKLYSNTGNGTDGSVTQKLVTDELAKKLDKTLLSTSVSETTTGKVLDATIAKTLNDKIESKVETSSIVNTLTETGAGKVLDARQGKNLKDSIDTKLDKNDLVTDLDISVPGKVADASAIKTLNDKISLLTTQLSQLKTEFNDYKTAHP